MIYLSNVIYTIIERNFNIGKILEMELSFKTSELNGILLSVADRDGFPALSLELKEGNVSFNSIFGYFRGSFDFSVVFYKN